MMPGEDIPLAYDLEARSLHTLVRLTDDQGEVHEMLFDNLTTPMYLLAAADVKPTQEFVGFHEVPAGTVLQEFHSGPADGAVVLVEDWRQYASGSAEETLFIEATANPADVFGEAWSA